MPRSLSDWLRLLEKGHPVEIELGLSRVNQVAQRLNLTSPAPKTVCIAGTNGKGSCIAIMDSLLRASGLNTGVYTSPHLIAFNERICINGVQVSDDQLCHAFTVIETAQLEAEPVSLTYFEFTTLAGLWLIKKASVDVALLEIGLGGRLDAVNIVDADIAIITSVAMDHEAWLGSDINIIGEEKAAISKKGKPVIYGDIKPVIGVLSEVEKQCGQLYQNGDVFSLHNNSFYSRGIFEGDGAKAITVHANNFPPQSLSCALQALHLLGVGLAELPINALLGDLVIPGRFQKIKAQGKSFIIDVAHNPAAAERLAKMLVDEKISGKIIAIFSVMEDKDIKGILSPLKELVDRWILPNIARLNRAAKPHYLQTLLYNAEQVSSIDEALDKALSIAERDDVILVCGSFYLAGPVLEAFQGMR